LNFWFWKMPFIIDGHNLLWSIEESREWGNEAGLCRAVSGYLKAVGETGEIIFDGAGPKDKSGFDNIANLEVFFAGPGKDADTVIEDKIRVDTAPRRLVVVSSDRRLRKAARTRDATVIKSEVFWEKLRKELSKKKTTKEPAGKRDGLTESETKRWLEFFGIEQ